MRLNLVSSIVILAGVSAAYAQDVASEHPPAGLQTANKLGQVDMQQKGPEMANPMAQSLVAGVIALALGQPYAVYYPLLLGGIILTAVCGGIRPGLRHGYEQRELRRMAAMDAGVGNSQSKEKL